MNIENVAHATSSSKRVQKKKWDKNPPKDKGASTKKKPRDVF
jgi:hypothetical protein